MGVDSTRKQGLIGLIWQILLFAVSSFFLCGVLPYQLFNGRFKASHILFVFFWIWVWHSAYKKLFPKKDAPTIEQPEMPQSHSSLSHSAAQTSPIEITQPDQEKNGQGYIPSRSDLFEKPLQNEGESVENHLVSAGLSTGVQVGHQFDQTACPNGQATDISKLKNLLDLGLITQEHFEKRKAEI